MPRTLTANALAKIASRFGGRPVAIVGVFWNGVQEIRYADREVAGLPGRVLEIGELDEVVRVEGSSSNASVTVTLDDTPGDLKAIFDATDIHKRRVVIYQYFEGMSLDDAFVLMVGQINTPVSWDESERKLTFTVLSKVEENQTGFAPEEGQFNIVNAKFIGRAWPLAFGDVMHVPATQITEQPRGVTQTLIGIPDYTLVYKYWHLIDRFLILQRGYRYYSDAIELLNQISREPASVIWDYVEAILEEDPRKQRHEDLSTFIVTNDKTVEELKQALAEETDEGLREKIVKLTTLLADGGNIGGDPEPITSKIRKVEQIIQDRADAQALVDKLTNQLGPYREECAALTDDLEKIRAIKELLEIEASNAEFAYKNIHAISKKVEKLLVDYVKTAHEISKVVTIMEEHKNIPQHKVTVINGDRFPQGQQVRVSIAGMTYAGMFAGRQFTATGYEPRYENLVVAQREDDQIDAFWLADDSVNIKGHYCVTNVPLRPGDPEYILAQSGVIVHDPVTRVFKVVDQIGRKCVIELVELAPSIRLKRQTPNVPVMETLPDELWDALQYAQEHTSQEKERILEGAIEKYDKEELARIKGILTKIRDATLEGAAVGEITDDAISATNETIYKNIHEYNDKVAQLTFTKETIDKVFDPISKHEFDVLLRLCNLQLRLVDQEMFNDRDVPNVKVYYMVGTDVTRVNATSPIMLPQWFEFSPGGQELTNNRTVIPLPSGGRVVADFLPESTLWVAEPGSEVTLITDTTEKYVANILPSQIKAVYGWKAVNGVRQLVPIPLSYYTKSESDASYPPLACATVTLKKPLKDYAGEDWEGGVYVSLISSVGPNTADIISWILTTNTNVVPDAATFADVAAKVANFPSHFCLFEKKETLALVQEVAWQARCGVFVKDDVAYIRYLSEEPTPTATVTESDVVFGSLAIEYTNTDNLVTKFVAKWRPDYAKSDAEASKIIIRYNLPRYGEVEQVYDFYIYNLEDLVNHSATFWMIRNANTWKRARFKTPLNKLDVETMDAVTLDFGLVSSAPVTAIVEKAQYDSADNSVNFECWLPVRAGEMAPYDFAFPAGLSYDTFYPTVDEINAGFAGSPHSSVPKNIAYKINLNENLVEQLLLRPKDYGEIFVSDSRFSLPPSPLLGLDEQDYLRFRPGDFKLSDQPRTSGVDTKPGYETPVGGQQVEETFSKGVFVGRVKSVTDALTGEYLVADSTGREFAVHQFSNGGALNPNQAVTVIYDDRQKRLVTNDSSSSTSGEIISYLAEITLTSGAGQQTSYIVDIFDGQDYSAFDTLKESAVEVFQTTSPLKSYFNGEVVVVRKISGIWTIQKLVDSKLRLAFAEGELGIRLCYTSSINQHGTYSQKLSLGASNLYFLMDRSADYRTVVNYLDTHTATTNLSVFIKGSTNAILGQIIVDTTVPIRDIVVVTDILRITISFVISITQNINTVTLAYSQDGPECSAFPFTITAKTGGAGGSGSVSTITGSASASGLDSYDSISSGAATFTRTSNGSIVVSGDLVIQAITKGESLIDNDKIIRADRVVCLWPEGSIIQTRSANYTGGTFALFSSGPTIVATTVKDVENLMLDNSLQINAIKRVVKQSGQATESVLDYTVSGGGLK